jgi:isochorismate hydrolase
MQQNFARLLDPSSILLLVVDMQEPFLRTVHRRDSLIRNVSFLLESARIMDLPIISTVQYEEKMGGPIPAISRLLPEGSRPLDKLCFSCGSSDVILSAIQNSGRRQVLISGAETHICILQTALELADQYEVHLAADAVSARGEIDHEIALRRMQRAGIVLTTAESAVYQLLRTAGTPQFKEILRLIKSNEAR